MKKVAIIIVNYKDYAKKFLVECRDSLRNQSYLKENFCVYIVDNDSSAETRFFITETYPEAKIVVRQDGNYSAANNAGIKKAIDDGCSLFVIANMDTRFDKDWLSELVKASKADDIGIVQSKILLYPKTDEEKRHPLINTIGNKMHFLGFGFTDGYRQKDHEMNESIIEIKGYASGCSLLVKKEVLDKIGIYDEEYYMYHDDIELCWRTKLAGYTIVLAPKSVVYHRYEFSRSVRMLYFMERNRFLAIFSYYKLATIMLILPALIIFEFGMLFFSIIHANLFLRLKIYYYFLKPATWRNILRVRKEVAKVRVTSDRDIIKNFAGKIEFCEIENWILKNLANPVFNFYWFIARKFIIW
ncbi:glycosyltransferase family 2 protein [Candidatus Falkowbacteria bacterium]|nr:glycosyltransferase family 2 protein [Candidatus Falkowbacteria bacterium]